MTQQTSSFKTSQLNKDCAIYSNSILLLFMFLLCFILQSSIKWARSHSVPNLNQANKQRPIQNLLAAIIRQLKRAGRQTLPTMPGLPRRALPMPISNRAQSTGLGRCNWIWSQSIIPAIDLWLDLEDMSGPLWF